MGGGLVEGYLESMARMQENQRRLRPLLYVPKRSVRGTGSQTDRKDGGFRAAHEKRQKRMENSGRQQHLRLYDIGFFPGTGRFLAGGGMGDDTGPEKRTFFHHHQTGAAHWRVPAAGLGRGMGKRFHRRNGRKSETAGSAAGRISGAAPEASIPYL